MYTMTLSQMAFHSHIGVYPEEKVVGQKLTLDLTLTLASEPEADDLNTTVNYGALYQEIAAHVNQTRVDLIETLAANLLTLILSFDRRIHEATLTVNKWDLPIDGMIDHVSVTLQHTQPGGTHD